MIRSNAALVGAYWERLLVLPSEQRRVAGREPPSEQQSEGQPGYLGEWLLHLHPHRAPTTATQPRDIPAYGQPRYAQPGYGYPGYSGYPAYSGPPGYGHPGYSGQPAYPASPGYGYPGYSGYPANPGSPYGYQSRPPYSPYSGSGYGNPVAGYPGDRPSEDWSSGAEYGIEPAS